MANPIANFIATMYLVTPAVFEAFPNGCYISVC